MPQAGLSVLTHDQVTHTSTSFCEVGNVLDLSLGKWNRRFWWRRKAKRTRAEDSAKEEKFPFM